MSYTFLKPLLAAAVVCGLALPVSAILLPPVPQDLSEARTTGTADEAVSSLLVNTEQQAASVSPMESMLLASSVANSFGGPPFYYFGDVNADGVTDLLDFFIMKSNFGRVGPTAVRGTGDVTEDFIVDTQDFAVIKFFFGARSPFLP